MRHLYLFLLFSFFLTHVGAQDKEVVFQQEQSDELLKQLRTALANQKDNKQQQEGPNAQQPAVEQPTQTAVFFENYWQVASRDSVGVSHQSRLSLRSAQRLFGVGFELGGALYLNDWQVDKGRSGLHFSYQREQLMEQLRTRYAGAYAEQAAARMEALAAINPRLAAAQKTVRFEEYLEVINSPEYQQYFKKIHAETDSLQTRAYDSLNPHEQEWLTKRQELDKFNEHYRSLLSSTHQLSAELRHRASSIVDSVRQMISVSEEDYFRQQLLRAQGTGVLKKLLLLSSGFSVGNTRLAEDGFVSAGLPIRGISYTYDNGGLQVSLQHGRRMLSDRFLPQDGVAFHDQRNNMRMSRLALSLGAAGQDRVGVFGVVSREINQQGNSDITLFPRVNRVFGLEGEKQAGDNFSLLFSAAHATTVLNSRDLSNPSLDDANALAQMAISFGGRWRGKNTSLDFTAFRRGSAFRSFANPYLYTDYQGAEAVWTVSALAGRLFGHVQLSGGLGTEKATQENWRWRAQGQLRYRLGPTTTFGLMAAPNVYRYEVAGTEGFSESNIYRVDLQQQGKLGSRSINTRVSVTNLDRGWSWQDTTQVSKSLLFRGRCELELSESITLSTDAVRGLGAQFRGADGEWFHALGLRREGSQARVQDAGTGWRISLRYDKHRFEDQPAWGGALDLSVPLGKMGVARLSLIYRKANELFDQPSPELFSYQSLESHF